jgi:hypothetical protein
MRKDKQRKEGLREGNENEDTLASKSPTHTSRKLLQRKSFDDKRQLRMFRAGQGNSGGRLSEMQGGALGFTHRLEDDATLDESSKREDDSASAGDFHADDDVGFEAAIVNDVFWRVHGNKCMTLKFNQEVVSRLMNAAQAEVDREDKHENKSSRMLFHHNSAEEDSPDANNNDKAMKAYLCGSPGFDDSVRDWLIESGLSTENITNFYASPSVHL